MKLALLVLLATMVGARAMSGARAISPATVAQRPLRGLILVGEPVQFANGAPQFSREQLRRVSAATREGLARWAQTDHGRNLIARFNHDDYQIFVVEDGDERALGRAPQPAIGTMVASADRSKLKIYRLVLNPAVAEDRGITGDRSGATGDPGGATGDPGGATGDRSGATGDPGGATGDPARGSVFPWPPAGGIARGSTEIARGSTAEPQTAADLMAAAWGGRNAAHRFLFAGDRAPASRSRRLSARLAGGGPAARLPGSRARR